MGRNMSPFTMEVVAQSKDAATEWTVSTLGSRHKCDRRRINVDAVDELAPADVQDHALRHKLGV